MTVSDKRKAQLVEAQRKLRDRRRAAGWVKIWIPPSVVESKLYKQLMALIENYKG